jgi:peptidoglycan hydrolase-like protein with peptidoglycan-binding domain
MRMLGAVLLVLAAALPAAGQNNPSQPGATAKPAAQVTKFRRSGIRPKPLRAGAAARRPPSAASAPDASPAQPAAARKRVATLPPSSRDASMPLADRFVVQFDLAWTGEYNGLIDGEVNEKTTAAIKAFQKNRKFKETGVLNTQERALLAASAKAKQAQVGWTMVDDAVTGARLGIPTRQVPNKSQGKSGTRWTSAQGQVQIETFKIREPGTTLASVYEQQKKEPATRKLEVNLLRDNFFILSGMQSLKKFHVRAELKDGEVRGMTVLYDQATENIMDPVAVVMSGAFTGFPNMTGTAQMGAPSRRKVEYGTGIVVSGAGHILTDRALTDGCHVVVVSGYGDADRQAEDRASDLALLRVYGVPDLVPAAFADDTAKGADLTLLGIADPQSQGGGSTISAVTGRLKGDTVEPAPQVGFSGAAALDGQHRVIGMVELKSPVVAALGPSTAQPQATVIPGATVRAFLAAQELPPAAGRPGLDSAKASLVRVICVRK